MDLLLPKIMSLIVDEGIQEGNQALIYQQGFKMLGFAVLGLLGGFGCTVCSSRAALGFGDRLRRDIFRQIQSFSFAETDHFTTGSLVTRLTNDVQVLQHVVMMISRMLIRTPLLLLGSVYLVFTTNATIALPLLGAAPILSGLVIWKIRQMRPQFEKMQQRIDDVNHVMQENLTGIRVVKAFANETHEQARFDQANAQLTETSITTAKIMITLGPWLGFVQQITLIVILFLGASQLNQRLLQIGEMAAIINYSTQVMLSLIMMSFQIMHFSRALVSANRLSEVFQTTPSVVDGPHALSPSQGTISFHNVSFQYPQAIGEPVLKNISLDIQPGEYLAIMGTTGSGKTSLVNLIPRFYDPSEGSITLDGVDSRSLQLHALRDAIGIVPQETRLFSGTIAENICWGNPSASMEQIQQAARIAGADDFIQSFPEGYDTPIAQGGTTLSGGQKQRIALARALIKKPRILILDDSTSAVDVLTEARIQSALQAEMKGMTVIKIAQRVHSILDADRIAVLEKGCLVALGTHRTLLQSSPVYREICDSQKIDQEVPYAS